MVAGLLTTCAISAYHHSRCEFEPRSLRDVLNITLCDKVCQWLTTGRWFSPGAIHLTLSCPCSCRPLGEKYKHLFVLFLHIQLSLGKGLRKG
jgi:hypothetical protein